MIRRRFLQAISCISGLAWANRELRAGQIVQAWRTIEPHYKTLVPLHEFAGVDIVCEHVDSFYTLQHEETGRFLAVTRERLSIREFPRYRVIDRVCAHCGPVWDW